MNHADSILAESLLQQVRHSPVLVGSGVLAVILLLAVVRVVFYTGRHRHRSGHREHHRGERNATARQGEAAGAGNRAQRRRRRRDRLNPTLAETRGLPPPRNESSNPPPN
jgi:hypothetical protein